MYWLPNFAFRHPSTQYQLLDTHYSINNSDSESYSRSHPALTVGSVK
jgi:hypothetical protein